jgi:hypothetical protein
MKEQIDCGNCALATHSLTDWHMWCERYKASSFYVPGQRCAGPSVRDVSGIAEYECLRNAAAG